MGSSDAELPVLFAEWQGMKTTNLKTKTIHVGGCKRRSKKKKEREVPMVRLKASVHVLHCFQTLTRGCLERHDEDP